MSTVFQYLMPDLKTCVRDDWKLMQNKWAESRDWSRTAIGLKIIFLIHLIIWRKAELKTSLNRVAIDSFWRSFDELISESKTKSVTNWQKVKRFSVKALVTESIGEYIKTKNEFGNKRRKHSKRFCMQITKGVNEVRNGKNDRNECQRKSSVCRQILTNESTLETRLTLKEAFVLGFRSVPKGWRRKG